MQRQRINDCLPSSDSLPPLPALFSSPTFSLSCFPFPSHFPGSSKLKYNLKVSNRAIKRPFLRASTHISPSLCLSLFLFPFPLLLSLLAYSAHANFITNRNNLSSRLDTIISTTAGTCVCLCVFCECVCVCVSQHVLKHMHRVCVVPHTHGTTKDNKRRAAYKQQSARQTSSAVDSAVEGKGNCEKCCILLGSARSLYCSLGSVWTTHCHSGPWGTTGRL